MDAQLFVDELLAPIVVPAIMVMNVVKMFKRGTDNYHSIDLLYATITFGTLLSAIYSIIRNKFTRKITQKSRHKLTILIAILLTNSAICSLIGFSWIRLNIPKSYSLPSNLNDQRKGKILNESSDVFRYHFFADFIPGFMILIQTQLCHLIQYELLLRAKRSFSLGEAAILSQLISATYLVWSFITYSRITDAGLFQVNLTTEIILNIIVILSLAVILPTYLCRSNKLNNHISKYILLFLAITLSFIRVQYLIGKHIDPIRWLVKYIFATHQRMSLFSIWLSTLTGCVSFSTSWTRMVGTTNSLVRKIFHLAIGIVFVTGYNQDIEFTRFASSGILIVMLLVETIRAWQLKPFGPYLEKVCQSLRGKWDNRYLTVSHIYLLVGVFVPLWLLPNEAQLTTKLHLSAGFIAVGIGDTAAAVFGTFFGKTRFRGESGKSLEGLLSNIVAMVICKLLWVGYTDFVNDFSFLLSVILTALVEAATNNCDNLILPLVMIFFIEVF